MSGMSDRRRFLSQTLGPGLLFAGTAVGVSHLVQSTRAGAIYGLGMALVIVAANVLKYPAFSFGPRYAAATGQSLIEGYRSQGRWAVILYGAIILGTMLTVQAAVTVVTAGLAKALLGLDAGIVPVSAGILAVCTGLLAVGRYRWLDRFMKWIVTILTVLTVVATVLVLPRIDWSHARLWPAPEQWNLQTVLFIAPLIGWMPSGLEISVWHSLWALAKRRDTMHTPTVRESLLDFQIGYVGTAILAICFMLLGAGVLHGSSVQLASSAGAFAGQIIQLYTDTLGDWSRYLIGACAFAVMFSTTLAVLDGFPRALDALIRNRPGAVLARDAQADTGAVYWVALAVLGVGAIVVLTQVAATDFKVLIDIATGLTFLTAPVLAVLNHRAILGREVPEAARPGPALRWFSRVSIGLLVAFAGWWLSIQLGA